MITRRIAASILAGLAIAALTLYAYRGLPARPFAADDYQWLLGVQGLSLGALLRRAFDPAAQSHFYRPLVWLLFWAQTRAFGLDQRGFHAVSLALHLLNAGLLGALAWRLAPKLSTENAGLRNAPSSTYTSQFSMPNFQFLISALAAAIVALHPAPFEAVVWISAQSELLAAALLLVALHLWLCRWRANDQRPKIELQPSDNRSSSVFRPWSLLAMLALGLALLAKESAVIGLPLLMLVGRGARGADSSQRAIRDTRYASRFTSYVFRLAPYALPTLLTLAYVALQIAIERRNYLLRDGGYGFGPQIVLNPLRSLALIVAPLAGTEHADAAWLIPVGALVAIALIGFTIYDLRFTIGARLNESKIANHKSHFRLVTALALTLLPTAPFASPPDSRYLYLPVMATALLIALGIGKRRTTKDERRSLPTFLRPSSSILRQTLVLCSLPLLLGLAWWSAGELRAREERFAAASGPGGSLWRVASAACAEARPDRVVVVEPPLAAPHAEAIVELSCGAGVRATIVGRDQIEGAIKGHTIVIAFPNGSAQVERRT